METLTETLLASPEPLCNLFSPWELTEERPRSLSGVKLDGDCLSRFIYVDESGTSANDASTVVAGVIVKGDKHWKTVAGRVAALVKKYIREEHRDGFCFSAKELIGGSGKVFGNRDKYPLNLRLEALKELLAIPSQFGLTLVFGVSTKNPGDDLTTKDGRRDAASKNQAKAFGTCILAAEKYMQRYAGRNELATLVAEDNPPAQDMVEWMHEILQGRTSTRAEQGIFKLLCGLTPNVLPIKKIIDTVHFAKKREAPLLQIADVRALTMRFHFENRFGCRRTF
jgi:hypothetical protein